MDAVICELQGVPHAIAVAAARHAIDNARQRARRGAVVSMEEVVGTARRLITEAADRRVIAAINATGVLLHTNLGRAPLGPKQLDAMRAVAGYSTLEFDRLTGKRGTRNDYVESVLTALTGAEAAVVANNNAAVLLLALRALCHDREVIVSRGELIEIGGEFRIPEILEESGARLVEVGTTNRTHLSDYERAIGPNTASILKVHTSNYRVVGFTAAADTGRLATLAHEHDVVFLHDLGSGLIRKPVEWKHIDEPTVADAVRDGADVVTFSGDKLLGGPQSGIAVGKRSAIDRIKSQPLMRAARVDKIALATLEETLAAHLNDTWRELPLWQLALVDETHLRKRAEALTGVLRSRLSSSVTLTAEAMAAAAGGGSIPGSRLASWGIRISSKVHTPDEIRRRLLSGQPPVVARIEGDAVLADLRTVPVEEDDAIAAAIVAAAD